MKNLKYILQKYGYKYKIPPSPIKKKQTLIRITESSCLQRMSQELQFFRIIYFMQVIVMVEKSAYNVIKWFIKYVMEKDKNKLVNQSFRDKH